MTAVLHALRAFVTTRLLSRRSLSRAAFERQQAKTLSRWLRQDLPKAPFYRDSAPDLAALPVIDKALVMANFEHFNTRGVTAETAWDAIGRDSRIGDLTVGSSTGTSGNRGLFVISEPEKYRWLGFILAKTIADILWRRQRVAVILPQNTSLYDSARKTGRIDLRFFDLKLGPERWQTALEDFNPTVIIAPPRILAHFAMEKARLTPVRVFSAAETLDPVDRTGIEAYFGLRLDQIYMATEGLLAVTCRKGGLHLAEDSVYFEFEPVGDGLVSPLVTSFRRQTQIMARYRMNDLLRLSKTPCSCGSPLITVDEVVGRMDDVFRLDSPSGPILVTPDILRNSVLLADRRIQDFRLVQTTPRDIELHLPPALPADAATAAVNAVTSLLASRAAQASVTLVSTPLGLDTSRKLRRVECRVKREQPA